MRWSSVRPSQSVRPRVAVDHDQVLHGASTVSTRSHPSVSPVCRNRPPASTSRRVAPERGAGASGRTIRASADRPATAATTPGRGRGADQAVGDGTETAMRARTPTGLSPATRRGVSSTWRRRCGTRVRRCTTPTACVAGSPGSTGRSATADLAVTVGEGVAFCHSLDRLSATPQEEPEGFTMWFRSTACASSTAPGGSPTSTPPTPFYMDGQGCCRPRAMSHSPAGSRLWR